MSLLSHLHFEKNERHDSQTYETDNRRSSLEMFYEKHALAKVSQSLQKTPVSGSF